LRFTGNVYALGIVGQILSYQEISPGVMVCYAALEMLLKDGTLMTLNGSLR